MSAGLPKVVLHVVDGLGLSGKTQNLLSVVSHLDRQRFLPIVCRFDSGESPLVRQLAAAEVPLHTIACKDGLNPAVAFKVARLARSINADIVHCHNPRPMLYGGLAARAIGIRATVGFLSAFACQVPDRSYAFLPQPLTTTSPRNVYRNRIGAASMRFIVTVSTSLGQRFCEYSRVPVEKLRVIAYGADLQAVDRVTELEAFALRRRLGFRADDIVVGSVGRLVEQKDYPTQLTAFALAAARISNLRMAIAGDGPLRSTLERMARDLAIDDRVTFLGNCDNVPRLLRSVDLFVQSSRFEPFGVALLEAKAAGLPIVATAVNEIPDIVTDGESGLLTQPHDAANMAGLFIKLAEDRDWRARLGARARFEARQRHDLQTTVSAYESLYDEAFAHRSETAVARPMRA